MIEFDYYPSPFQKNKQILNKTKREKINHPLKKKQQKTKNRKKPTLKESKKIEKTKNKKKTTQKLRLFVFFVFLKLWSKGYSINARRNTYSTHKSVSFVNPIITHTNIHYVRYFFTVNGGWSSWYSSGSWNRCSASCRTCGSSVIPLQSLKRRRSCTKPSPGCGGKTCHGSSYKTTSRYCNTSYCKVNGGWSSWKPWGSWGKCSAECKTCGSNSKPYKTRRRYRVCNNPTPACNGNACPGSRYITSSTTCNTHYCKVNGGWSKWYYGNWGSCSASCKKCGSNTNPTQSQRRYRYCNNPSRACGGRSCRGSSSHYSFKSCNTHYCKGKFAHQVKTYSLLSLNISLK
ncbi:coadhesin-like isoform X1 [Mytilus californianus]|uniref:coadhesin-like isoform X1 n=1 Tax=Mytilus californianus TaxID=6549 RepID=UPI002245A408|nr:coadhesin-like isoform X1 [Mytilus californianus]